MTGVAEASPSDALDDHGPPPRLEKLVGVGAAWKLVGQIGVQGIRLLTVAILARLLGPADYGAAAIVIAFAAFAPTVADMGMGSALVQTGAAPQQVRSTVFWASLAFGGAYPSGTPAPLRSPLMASTRSSRSLRSQ